MTEIEEHLLQTECIKHIRDSYDSFRRLKQENWSIPLEEFTKKHYAPVVKDAIAKAGQHIELPPKKTDDSNEQTVNLKVTVSQ